DVPNLPDDYIHRSGRTARAEAVGDAVTFVSPQEEGDFRAIERAVGRRIERVTLPDFDYTARTTERLEIPLAQRLSEIRGRRTVERARTSQRQARHHESTRSFRPLA